MGVMEQPEVTGLRTRHPCICNDDARTRAAGLTQSDPSLAVLGDATRRACPVGQNPLCGAPNGMKTGGRVTMGWDGTYRAVGKPGTAIQFQRRELVAVPALRRTRTARITNPGLRGAMIASRGDMLSRCQNQWCISKSAAR